MQDSYESNEAYLEEMMDRVRDWIRLYRKYAVALDDKGRLLQVKGSITFGNDLELSLEGQMTEEEKRQYEQEAAGLRRAMRQAGERAKASFRQGIVIPLEFLFRAFGLSEAGRFCVIMGLAGEYDRTMGRMFGLLQDDYKEIWPSLDLCLKIYTAESRRRIQERAQLLGDEDGIRLLMHTPLENSRSPVRLHPRILRFLDDFGQEDRELQGICSLRFSGEAGGKLSREKQRQAEHMARGAWREGSRNVCVVWGPPGAGKRTVIGQAAAAAKKPVLYIDTRALFYDRGKRDALLGAIRREMILRGAAACCVHGEVLAAEEEDSQERRQQKEQLMGTLLERLAFPGSCLFFASEKKWEGSWQWGDTVRTDWEIPFPSQEEQIFLWEDMLKPFGDDGTLPNEISPEGLSVRFSLTPGQMAEALKEAEDLRRALGKETLEKEMLYRACRRQLVMHLGSHVTRVTAAYRWEDLVLPGRQREALKRACHQVEFSHQVYGVWGFEEKVAYGRGVSMLFYGPPGTGKTMGAQVMANQLSMELYKVDLSSVMSKYIGETEKNLGKIFDEVKKSRNILFFDEADALFGKRTEVKDSHDKYANAETAYLLQKIEEYQGVVILATNYMQNFDEAFKRRIQFIIEFPFPAPEYRLAMWKKVFPGRTPVAELDYEYLARYFELSGSSIKNIAVAAAFLAAAEKEPVGMKQVLEALRDEMVKSGKSMPPESFGEYYGLISHCY